MSISLELPIGCAGGIPDCKICIVFRTPRTTRDWLHAIRALSPLCARHPEIFAATMERVTRKQKDQIIALPMAPLDPSAKQWAACSPIKQVTYD